MKTVFNSHVIIISLVSVVGLAACSSADNDSAAQRQTIEDKQLLIGQNRAVESAIDVELVRQFSEGEEAAQKVVAMPLMMDTTSIKTSRIMVSGSRIANEVNRENYQKYEENRVFEASLNPLSTFSIDVDTGSYTNVRRMLNQGVLPPTDAIRIEEFINYFDYDFGQIGDSENSEHPFVIDTQISVSPWDPQKHLIRIALEGKNINTDETVKRDRNLVFLLDVSGSMNNANKLPLVKKALTMLTAQLSENDSVAIVVYAGASGVVLEPTAGNQRFQIESALNKLSAGGSTNGGQGIELAYRLAQDAFKPNGINRVILATDGDFNVGTVDHEQLIDLIVKQRDKGIALTTLGFGQGNYNDHLMEQLANKGNGNYAYIDTLNEARKVLVEELDANMNTIAKDTKIQVEFNPAVVAEYRLVGYENRRLTKEDFNNDKVDAGEIGEGHRVTAFYEISMQTSLSKYNDELRYTDKSAAETSSLANANLDEIAHVKLRYKSPDSQDSQLITQVIMKDSINAFTNQSSDFKFATAVIEFAELLRNGKFTNNMNFEDVLQRANSNKGQDEFGYRSEFVSLVRMAMTIKPDLVISKVMD